MGMHDGPPSPVDMIDPRETAFFLPPGLKKFKLDLFERIGRHINDLGGVVVRHDYKALERIAASKIPIVGCSPPFADAMRRWQADGTPWIYWDRGYLRRRWSKGLPDGSGIGKLEGYYRWHVRSLQMTHIRQDVPGDRWQALKLDHCVTPWREGGDKIIIADTLADYWNLRGLPEKWSYLIADELRKKTKRPVIVRDKESKITLDRELEGAHALVTHGSIAAVEAAVLGYPVFVDRSCAAALVGETDFDRIEQPARPARKQWLHSLAYSQFTENELCDGTLWNLLE
jgi:hypothetical protein